MKYDYPFEHVIGDYVRAGIGFTVVMGLVLFAPLPRAVLIVFLALALLFLGFGIQTARRHRTRITITDDDILAAPSGVRMRWAEFTEVSLDYYAVAKESKKGWMQLTLRCDRKKLRIDSRINGFGEIARCAARAAEANGIALSPTSEANFAALETHDVTATRERATHG